MLQVTGKVLLLQQILPLYSPLKAQWLLSVQTPLANFKGAHLSPIPLSTWTESFSCCHVLSMIYPISGFPGIPQNSDAMLMFPGVISPHFEHLIFTSQCPRSCLQLSALLAFTYHYFLYLKLFEVKPYAICQYTLCNYWHHSRYMRMFILLIPLSFEEPEMLILAETLWFCWYGT